MVGVTHITGLLNQTDVSVKYTHLFFDLDGTLWDLKTNTRVALQTLFDANQQVFSGTDFQAFYARYHIHNDRVWALYRDGKMDKETLRVSRFRHALDDCGIQSDDSFGAWFADQFLEICPRLPHLIEGAMELLNHVNGKYELHIITNGFNEVQHYKMHAAGITSFFNHIIYSEEAGVRKPHKGIFDLAFQRTGADPSRSLMIGDDWDADILGARNAGMDQAFLTSTEDLLHELGSVTTGRPMRHNFHPTYTLNHLNELIAVL